MAVPKRRTSSQKRDSRRANHDKVSAPTLSRCSNCGETMRPHRVCPACGFYAGISVVEKTAPATDAQA
ncbi:MAG: 50S ribosomal protein L32 [Deltaproteobacteria bacterium]|nr:50S ribosomal protein L32 [Deltaproteobacteria bacterium]